MVFDTHSEFRENLRKMVRKEVDDNRDSVFSVVDDFFYSIKGGGINLIKLPELIQEKFPILNCRTCMILALEWGDTFYERHPELAEIV